MPHRSEPDLLVLTGLRLASVAPSDEVARLCDLPVAEVDGLLAGFEARGLVRHRAQTPVGWSLTPAGRAEGERLLADELDAAGLRPAVDDAYRRFRALNPDLLAACVAWQVREVAGRAVPNDHADAGHDAAAVAALDRVDDGAQPVCASLADALERFRSYGRRLAAARTLVDAGQGDWFTRPGIDSYHTVWFELHEHLLATLGRERADEHQEARP